MSRPRRVVVLSAHEGSTAWGELLRSVEARSSLTIDRISGYSDHEYRNSNSPFRRLRLRIKTYISYPLWVLRHSRRFARAYDTILVITSPFFLPAIVSWFAKGPRIVVLQNDIYPEALIVRKLIPRGGLIDRMLGRIIASGLQRAHAVVYITDAHRAHVARVLGPHRGDAVIPVPAHLPLPSEAGPALPSADMITVLYSGTLGMMHDTSTFLQYLSRKRVRPGVRFVFRTSGAGKVGFEKAVASLSPAVTSRDMVDIGGPLPDADWSDMMHAAQIGLVFQNIGASNVIFPSKAASILLAGQAILAIADETSALGKLITDGDCGWVVPPSDADRFVRALDEASNAGVLERKRRNARRLGAEQFAVEALADRWLQMLGGAT